MASGVPVVVSNTTSMPEICGDAAVYADPHLPESIAFGINKLLEDKIYYENMRNAGLTRAAGFRWAVTADKLMESILFSFKKKPNNNKIPVLPE
jgi:glycosyltransferase involved in cell wall biosynthesis